MPPKTVLITGCSQGGLGDALAQELSRRGHRVIATGRNLSKLSHFAPLNIETAQLDVLSSSSIEQCVATVAAQADGAIDMLINNSGGGFSMPLVDVSVPEARRLFDLNVWSVLELTQAFLPLLLQSKQGGMIVNNTSIVSVLPLPMVGIYASSKAAAAMLTDNLRLELAPFGITVVELKTGGVRTNFFDNQAGGARPVLPQKSIYLPAKDAIEKVLAGGRSGDTTTDATTWARQVVEDLLASKPPTKIWRGQHSWLVWFARRFLPYNLMDGRLEAAGGLNVLRKELPKAQPEPSS